MDLHEFTWRHVHLDESQYFIFIFLFVLIYFYELNL
jgi:hypothetical protein